MPRTDFTKHHYRAILEALADGPMLTPELAATIGLSGPRTYGRCRRLQDEKQWLRSDKTSHPQPYCVECRVILTSVNYEEHQEEDHDIRMSRTPVRRWVLTARGRRVLEESIRSGGIE